MSKFKDKLFNSSLASKIRYSYILLLIPPVVVLLVLMFSMWNRNKNYESMVNSALVASDFSLDFKKDFDYETYLVIVGNKTMDESGMNHLLTQAKTIVGNLESLTNSVDNEKRLSSISKYLSNLENYKEHIRQNLADGDKYEENIEIWENDVQIVTALIRETMFQYIYYEINNLQAEKQENRDFYYNIIQYVIIASLVVIIFIVVMSYLIPRSITKPIRELCDVTDQVSKGDLSVRSKVESGAEVGVLSDSMNTMIDKINVLINQVTLEQNSLREAELELLQAQINPHFLYNTLDTIVWLAEGNNEEAVVGMVKSLSEFFRTALSKGRDLISIEEEINHVRSYLEIQQVRYQDILEYSIEIPDEIKYCVIPKLSVQPIVENALYHGVKNKRGGGRISVIGEMKYDCYEIHVKDNGIGMEPERLKKVRNRLAANVAGAEEEIGSHSMFGMYNVNERIRLKFGPMYGISIDSAYGEGTEVTMVLPLNEALGEKIKTE